MVPPVYQPRDPSSTVLYQVIADHLETFLAALAADPMAKGLPDYVIEEFYAYLRCGILAHGFVRLGCNTCPHQMLLAFSCKKRGYLEAGTEDVVPTSYDPVREDDPELARTMAASVQQRIAFGERAGQKVRRIGSGFGYEGERPTLTGKRFASVHGFSLHANTLVPAHRRDQLERLLRYTARGAVSLERLEKLAALVPLPRMHLVRYGGCLAPHSKLRAAIIPTPRQQGMEEPEGPTTSPNWHWARLLKRVFAIDMERCPVCQQGTLHIIAVMTEGSVVKKILRHVKLAVDPPPIAPAQEAAFAWGACPPAHSSSKPTCASF